MADAREFRSGGEVGHDGGVRIRIEGFNLPGKVCDASDDFPGYRNIHVGVQRRNRPQELLDLVPGDASAAVWILDCTTAATSDGRIDVRGRYIQGSPCGRFIYLSWGTVDDEGGFSMFRRAKLFLDGMQPQALEQAADIGLLRGRLGLTDCKGHPLCAAVRPPLIEWSADPGD